MRLVSDPKGNSGENSRSTLQRHPVHDPVTARALKPEQCVLVYARSESHAVGKRKGAGS